MNRRSEAFVNPRSHPPKSFSLVFAQWCQATSFHGVPDFYFATTRLGRLIWSLILILGLFFTLNQTIELTLDFVREDRWLTSMYPEIPSDGVMKWPHIRICNRNLFSASKLYRAGIVDPYDAAYVIGGSKGLTFYDKTQTNQSRYENATDLDEKVDEIRWRLRIRSGLTKARLLQSLSFKCQDMMIYCDSNNGFVVDRPFCNCSDFHIQTADETGCFHVNASYLVSQSGTMKGRAGYESGLHFLVNPNINDYYPNLLNEEAGDSGTSMRLYFGSYNSDVLQFSSPIFISPGSHTVVAMSLQKHRTRVRERRGVNLYHTKLPCMEKVSYRWIRSSTPLRVICALDCTVHTYMLQCGCVPEMIMPAMMETKGPICDEDEFAMCRNKTQLDWHLGPWPDEFNFSRCVEECKDPCEYDTISTKVTASKFPAPTKTRGLLNYLNSESRRNGDGREYRYEEIRQFILMDLYHESNEYQVVERVNRVSLDEVVSNIGGALGAWTGMSFITMFHAMVYFGYGLKIFLSRLVNRKVDRAVIH